MQETELLSIVQKAGLFSLYRGNPKEFECFANLAAANAHAAGMEEAAKICDEMVKLLLGPATLENAATASDCAAAIRAAIRANGSTVNIDSIDKILTVKEKKELSPPIYVIKKLWTDSLENHSAYASGYSVIGYVTDEGKAKQLVADAGVYTGDCWAIPKDKNMPLLKYETVPILSLID